MWDNDRIDELVKNAVEHAQEKAMRNHYFWCIVFDILYGVIFIGSVVLFLIALFSKELDSDFIKNVMLIELACTLFLLIHSGYFLPHLILCVVLFGVFCLVFGIWVHWYPITEHLVTNSLLLTVGVYSLIEFLRELGWTFLWGDQV